MSHARTLKVLREVASTPAPGPRSPVRERMRAEALELARREGLGQASYSWRILPLDEPPGEVLRVQGAALRAPWLVPETGELTALAFGVCTLGPALEERVSALFAERRVSLALALDNLGAEFLFAASRRLQDRLLTETARKGLTMAGELHPGDPGLGLDAQGDILRLADAESIGVTRVRAGCLYPLKSTSVVFGVGVDLPEAKWSRCDHCPSRAKCRLRPGAAMQPAA